MVEYILRVTVEESSVDEPASQRTLVRTLLADTVAIHVDLGRAGIPARVEVTTPGGRLLALYGATALRGSGDVPSLQR